MNQHVIDYLLDLKRRKLRTKAAAHKFKARWVKIQRLKSAIDISLKELDEKIERLRCL